MDYSFCLQANEIHPTSQAATVEHSLVGLSRGRIKTVWEVAGGLPPGGGTLRSVPEE